jgi:hypothetical protein
MSLPERPDAGQVVSRGDAGGEGGGDPGCLLGHFITAIGPCFGHGRHHPSEGRHSRPVDFGVIGPGEEGLALRGQPNRHWPSSVTGHRLDRFHIDGIDIRSFLPIHLYVHEQAVHLGGCGGVFE